MKKTRSKIIIKTRKGGYTKIYANGKWQKKVCNIEFHADSVGYVGNGINISCVFDRYKTDKNGVQIYNVENNEFEVEHCSANI